jgi:hypothetical protein
MSITSRTTVMGRRPRREVATRAIRRMLLAFTVAALAAPVALPATAEASGGGCTHNGPINSCVQVDGSGLDVIDMRASIKLNPGRYVVGRLHVFGPAGFNLYKNFSYRSPSLIVGQYARTWGVEREVRPGPYCAQFEIDTGSGWQRYGNGPACLTVHQ